MLDKFKKILLCSALAILTAACSNSVENEAQADVESEAQAVDSTANVANDSQLESAPEVKEKAKAPSIALEDYVDINSFKDTSYLTLLFLAQTTRDISDEDKLGLMSAEYHSEQDQFKKSDLGKSILPKVNEEIEKYAGDFGIKIPFGHTSEPHNPYYSSYNKYHIENTLIGTEKMRITLQPYNFDKKQFPIYECVNGSPFGVFSLHSNRSYSIANDQGIQLHFASIAPEQFSYTTKEFIPNLLEYRYKDLNCALDIEDQEVAREIEGLRVNNKLDVKGFLYYKVTADQNRLIAQPEYAEYTFYNIDTGEDLVSGEFTWNDEDKI